MQAQALDLILCGACHGHRFYMILLMSSAVPPSHRARTRGLSPLRGAVLLYRSRCGSVRPLYCIRTVLQYNNKHGSLGPVPPPAPVGASSSLLFARVALSGLAGFVRIVRFAPAQPLVAVSWPSRCHPYRATALRDNRPCSTTWATNSHLGPSSNASLVWC